MASNEISSEEAEEKEYVTSAKNQYLAACIVSGLASLSIGTFLLYTVSPSCLHLMKYKVLAVQNV